MLFKKILSIIALVFCFSHLVASETNSFSPNINQENESDVSKQTSTQQSVTSKKESKQSNTKDKQSNTEKKSNMVDYCRKNTC